MVGPQEMQEACVSRTQCEESSLHLPPLKMLLVHETAPGHKGQEDGEHKGAGSQRGYAAVIPQDCSWFMCIKSKQVPYLCCPRLS